MADREVITKIVLNHLSECNDRYFTVFKNDQDRNKQRAKFLNILIAIVNGLKRLEVKLFRQGILEKNWDFEVLGYLNKADLLDFGGYFAAKDGSSPSAGDLAENLIFCMASRNSVDLEKTVLGAICEYCKNEQALDGCLMTCFTELCYEQLRNSDRFLKTVQSFRKEPAIFYILTKLSTCAFMDTGTSINEALFNPNTYKPSNSENLTVLMKTVVSYSGDVNDVCSFLIDFMLNFSPDMKINWHNFSLLVCALTRQDGYTKLRSVIHELIEESLENSNTSQITLALLLGRICSLEESGLNLTYLQWFSMTFSNDSHRPLSTEKRAKFFMTVLTQLLDYEQPGFLKIYLHKVPCVPSSSQSELSDYLQLAKARLESLNESPEVGIFGTESANDVGILVDLFQKSGKIPQSFFGAIMLRKKYFEREFLPKLLQDCPGKLTSHHALIQQLAQLGKISNGVFKNHVEFCS